MTRASVRSLFRANLGTLRRVAASDLAVSLVFGSSSDFPAKRDYAYCSWDPAKGKATITVAPRIVRAGRPRALALLRHELAHAFLMAQELPHTERECDEVAERLFGAAIYYDADDVQTTDAVRAAHRHRPAHLPTGEGS